MAVVSRPLKTGRDPDNETRLRQFYPLLIAVVYVLALVALVVLLQHALVWGQRRMDDLRYGFPRTVHLNAVTGPLDDQATPSHFVALNLNGQVSVLVVPNGDTSQVQTLAGPYLVGRDGAYEVPRLTLEDVNGDAWRDLLVTLRGEVIIYINENGSYRLITPEERLQLAEGNP